MPVLRRQIILAGFKMSKCALNDLFRHEDHPGYMVAGDQALRNFFDGLIIYKHSPKGQFKAAENQ